MAKTNKNLPAPEDRPLSPRQQRFVEEYIIDLNATQAARRAGYSQKNAKVSGSTQLSKPNIQKAIAKATAARSQRTAITADRVVRELARIAFGDPRKLLNDDGTLKPLHELDDDTAATISSFEMTELGEAKLSKAKVWDKNAALDKLMRHLGAYAPEQFDHRSSDGSMTPPTRIELVPVKPRTKDEAQGSE